MNIGWMSNHRRVGSGYGNQTNLFAPALKKAGHDVSIFTFYGIDGHASLDEDGIISYPGYRDGYCNDIIEAHMSYTGADLLITLVDPWVLDANVYGKLPWAAWAPIDSAPMLPANKDALAHASWILAMSRFGQDQIEAAGLGHKCFYVPHGVDTELFKPGNREEARQKMGELLGVDLTGKFLVVMNSANKGTPSRKGFAQALEAFKSFSDMHPDAILYLHTDKKGAFGEHIPTIIEGVGLDLAKVLFPPHYRYVTGLLPQEYLVDVYNAADVFLQSSQGEGFGIPIVEAQASGCPVIVTNFSAMKELCFSGVMVPGTKWMHTPGAYQMIPNVGNLAGALEWAQQSDGRAEVWRQVARAGALEYDYRKVMDKYFLPTIEKIAEQLSVKSAQEKERAEKREAVRVVQGELGKKAGGTLWPPR
jgi:glycosyltransferase involved in cell wall biosynthesis